jgi:flavodoxin
MSNLIVYYSRTGITRQACNDLAHVTGWELAEIREKDDRSGAAGYLRAGKDAALKKTPPIEPLDADPAAHELVVVATPVWAFTMAAPVRTWLSEHGSEIRKAAFICTMGGSGDKRTFQHMQALVGSVPAATLALIDKHVKAGQHLQPLRELARKLGFVEPGELRNQ